MENQAIKKWAAKKVKLAQMADHVEQLVVEEPLEIVLVYSTPDGRMQKNIAVTMRTPGFDPDLVVGFLFSEGIISNYQQLASVKASRTDNNQVTVTMVENEKPALTNTARNFISTASCGVCGKTGLENIRTAMMCKTSEKNMKIRADLMYSFPAKLSGQQDIFTTTGGLHAAALLDAAGNLLVLREDIGRHNAVDKIIGAAKKENYPLNELILLLSGRAGFELVQKAAMAGIPMIMAIGAPSSLAVEMAEECGITLVGFLKADRFNIYCGAAQIIV
ncbi:formate dehydrogenase accessory sulfurtransferase FdhD [Flavihumibacter fluvii]|uniref:formate dehydrogenase accessory sulfurtransferase FdhD n=1 Tax=Flavihumibacter fluvii TaxID=2838157 RepID=UPI001BDE48F6|nr:formate dehydrogenase accessory sulfurtransferase FdhD [Flavihumibacter fluvii]ULQ53461.1 formate dehydrogenase accessory sulfurtransferase FdhD [Flavihumibacter fluvii]